MYLVFTTNWGHKNKNYLQIRNSSGAPAREARVGHSLILMEYGQPLFAWLSRD